MEEYHATINHKAWTGTLVYILQEKGIDKLGFLCLYSFKAVWYSCTLAPPCTWAMSLPIVCILWLPRQCNLLIVTSQWVFTVMSLCHCYAPHFMNGAVTSALGKLHFVHFKFEQNYRLLIFNRDRICFWIFFV